MDLEAKLREAGRALSPDPARLKALLTPAPRPVPSPLSVSLYMKAAVGALALVLVIAGTLWTTTPGAVAPDEYQIFSASLDEDFLGESEALALLDEGVAADLEAEDVFTDEFLEVTL